MFRREKELNETCAAAVTINQDYCSRCSVCYSVCPYEAIKRDAKADRFEIDLQKCQVCGICYSACPSIAIEMVYYDNDSLLKCVRGMQEKKKSDTLVLMCRGNSPSNGEVEEILHSQGLNINSYVSLRLPCSGRVPTEFVFQILKSGIKNVISIQCEDEFCRFKLGTKIAARRMVLGKTLLEQLGVGKNALRVVKYSRKAAYITDKCVGCDKCVFICPYEAIEAETFATPKILSEKCVGCGACALVCPHHAIQVTGFEFEDVSKLIAHYAGSALKLKADRKSPAILVFCCQWSEFSALDDPECLLFKRKAVGMEIPCFKALDPAHVVEALQCGFDGVMAVVCSAEDCKLEKGRETSERNTELLIRVLEKKGLRDRFELFTVSPRCVGDFNKRLEEFIARIAGLPPVGTVSAEAVARV